jgi:hypothetical protein
MKNKGYPCRREKQPVTEKIDKLMVYYVYSVDGGSMIDYMVVFGRVREELVKETVNEEEFNSEGRAVIYPQSPVVVLEVFSQIENSVSGFPLFTETRTRWLYVDGHGWLMVWKKVYEIGLGYRVMTDCIMYELPEDALRVYKGLNVRVKTSPTAVR